MISAGFSLDATWNHFLGFVNVCISDTRFVINVFHVGGGDDNQDSMIVEFAQLRLRISVLEVMLPKVLVGEVIWFLAEPRGILHTTTD
jgi:hypothetical protein